MTIGCKGLHGHFATGSLKKHEEILKAFETQGVVAVWQSMDRHIERTKKALLHDLAGLAG